MKKKINQKYFWYTIIIIYILSISYSFLFYENKFNIQHSTPDLLKLLADYEGVYILDFKKDIDNDTCLESYDVGDGVITFGLGKTFPTEQEGINNINQLNNTSYKNNDCIKIKHLIKIHEQDILRREEDILLLDKKYHANLNQQEFDAIMLMYYLNEDTITNEKFWKIISRPNLTSDQYTNYFLNIYSQFENYDTYKDGWNARIYDSADIFFDAEYLRDF